MSSRTTRRTPTCCGSPRYGQTAPPTKRRWPCRRFSKPFSEGGHSLRAWRGSPKHGPWAAKVYKEIWGGRWDSNPSQELRGAHQLHDGIRRGVAIRSNQRSKLAGLPLLRGRARGQIERDQRCAESNIRENSGVDDGTRTRAKPSANRSGSRRRQFVRPTGITLKNRSRSLSDAQS